MIDAMKLKGDIGQVNVAKSLPFKAIWLPEERLSYSPINLDIK